MFVQTEVWYLDNWNMQNSMLMFTLSTFDFSTFDFLGKFNTKNQAHQFKLKFGTKTNQICRTQY